MNQLKDVLVNDKGEEIDLDKWYEDANTGERIMYSRPQTIGICSTHAFDKRHECSRCPYVFTGFRGHLHIQKEDGIYERQTGKKIA